MSFAAPKLRAERRRYVMELTNPSVVPETPAHLLDDADDDAAWDDDASPFDAVAAAGKATRRMEMKTPPVVTNVMAKFAARDRDEEKDEDGAAKTVAVTDALTQSVREALNDAERGLRASLVVDDARRKRGVATPTPAGKGKGGGSGAAPTPATPLADLARPTEALAMASLGADAHDDEAQEYLKGVLKMIYGGGGGGGGASTATTPTPGGAPPRTPVADWPEAASAAKTTPRPDPTGRDDSAREAVVARHVFHHSPASDASPSSNAAADDSPTQISPIAGKIDARAEAEAKEEEGTVEDAVPSTEFAFQKVDDAAAAAAAAARPGPASNVSYGTLRASLGVAAEAAAAVPAMLSELRELKSNFEAFTGGAGGAGDGDAPPALSPDDVPPSIVPELSPEPSLFADGAEAEEDGAQEGNANANANAHDVSFEAPRLMATVAVPTPTPRTSSRERRPSTAPSSAPARTAFLIFSRPARAS